MTTNAVVRARIDEHIKEVKPDLVLIYRKPDTETLQLVKLGWHSESSL